MVPLSNDLEYLKYCAFYGQSFYRTLIGNHTQSIEWSYALYRTATFRMTLTDP